MRTAKKKPASRSILIQILIPMALVMLVQSSLFTVTLLFGGTVEQLRTNAFDILTERVNNRKNYLQNEMIQRWSNMGEAVDSFQTKIQTLLDDADASPEHLTVSSSLSVTVLEKLSEDMNPSAAPERCNRSICGAGGGWVRRQNRALPTGYGPQKQSRRQF